MSLVKSVQIEVLESDNHTASVAVYLNGSPEPEVFHLVNRHARSRETAGMRELARGDTIVFSMNKRPQLGSGI